MGKFMGKIAVITGGSSGMGSWRAPGGSSEEGVCVFITGRRQEALDEAVRLIGRNVTGLRATSLKTTTSTACSTQSAEKG